MKSTDSEKLYCIGVAAILTSALIIVYWPLALGLLGLIILVASISGNQWSAIGVTLYCIGWTMHKLFLCFSVLLVVLLVLGGSYNIYMLITFALGFEPYNLMDLFT